MACPCGEHATYGAHLRAKGIRVGYCRSAKNLDATTEKRTRRELDLYADARRQGVQPQGTRTPQIREALDVSDRIGRAFDAAKDSKYVTE